MGLALAVAAYLAQTQPPPPPPSIVVPARCTEAPLVRGCFEKQLERFERST